MLGRLAIATCLALPASAFADSPAEHVARGEQLAKQGRLTEAIDAFKSADTIERRAKHACLIALAYIRRELWPQAEVFMATCHERASTADPLPDWAALAEQQLAERLASAKVAAVTIRVEPAAMASRAMITVSSFAPDEKFAPRTVHLPPGKHLITASVDGEVTQQTIELASTSPREVVLRFVPAPGSVPPAAPVECTTVSERPGTSRVPLVVGATGAAIVLGGAAYHLFAFKPARDRLADASAGNDVAAYDARASEFDSRRTTTIALYAGGAAVLATALVLRYTLFKDERALRASAAIGRRDALVTLEWRR